jgi:hypothetical protein
MVEQEESHLVLLLPKRQTGCRLWNKEGTYTLV